MTSYTQGDEPPKKPWLIEPNSGLSGVVSGYCPVSYTCRIAPRLFSTQKWLLSTVSSEPDTMFWSSVSLRAMFLVPSRSIPR